MESNNCNTANHIQAGCDNRANLHTLLDQLDEHAPRFTSYPPANHLISNFSEDTWVQLLKKDQEELDNSRLSKFSLYIHIPFCKSLCFFCACNRIVTGNKAQIQPYLDTVNQQIDKYRHLVSPKSTLYQLHLGGGTPNYLEPKQLEALVLKVKESFNLDAEFNFSIELDPRTCTPEHLDVLVKTGCNRVSIGVQDFNPEVQQAINRIQSFEMSRDFVSMVRAKGISIVGIDMIYGLPLQTKEAFARTMEEVMQIRPNRIAAYGYAHVPAQAPAQKKLSKYAMPDKHNRLDLLLDAIHYFTSQGYKYIGLDHFVLEDDPLWSAFQNKTITRSFMGYNIGNDVPVLGIGISSISGFPSIMVQNQKDLASFKSDLENSKLAISKGLVLNRKDQLVGNMIKDILSLGELDFSKYETMEYFQNIIDETKTSLEKFVNLGLIKISENKLSLNFSGQVYARAIAKAFDYRGAQITGVGGSVLI